ncbi:MAG: purine-binding chemotaxis protein CheW [Lachnospiraceae bacterium]|nr:purine-binding chemotaxis protein CheW [Lachnospiraceae bacterium]
MEQLNITNGLPAIGGEQKGSLETIQYIVIRLGAEQYGIDIRYIDNIVRMQKITRVPKVPEYLRGVINLRGEVIPVMSLRLKMNLPADEYSKSTRIIILKLEQQGNIGVIVDQVNEVVTLTPNEIEKIAYDNKEGKVNFINGVGKYKGELISLLDLNTVTLDENV